MQNIEEYKLVPKSINYDNISVIFDAVISTYNDYSKSIKILEEKKSQIRDVVEQAAYFNFNSVINAICDVVSYFENTKFVVDKTSLVHTAASGRMLKPFYASDALILISSSEISKDKYYIDFELAEKIKNKKALLIDIPSKITIDDYENYTGTYEGNDKIIKFIDDSSEFIEHNNNIIEIAVSKFDSFESAEKFIKYLRGYKIKFGNQELQPEVIEILKENFIEEYSKAINLSSKKTAS
jgi:hypothetical protein